MSVHLTCCQTLHADVRVMEFVWVYPVDLRCIYELHIDIDDSRSCMTEFDKGGEMVITW